VSITVISDSGWLRNPPSHPTRAPGRYQAALVAPAIEVDNRYIAADAVPCIQKLAAPIHRHARWLEARRKIADEAKRYCVDFADTVRPGIRDIDPRSVRPDGNAARQPAYRYAGGDGLRYAVDNDQLIGSAAHDI